MGDPKKVSKGLNMMFTANVIAIFTAVCSLLLFVVPLLGLIAAIAILVSGVMSLVGLFSMRNEHEMYMKAVILCGIGIVLSLISGATDGVLESLLDLAGTVCSLIQWYFIIQATNLFLSDRLCHEEVAAGDRLWKWLLISTAVEVVGGVLSAVMFPLAMVVSIVVVIVGLVVLAYTLGYLNSASTALK